MTLFATFDGFLRLVREDAPPYSYSKVRQ